MKIHVRDVVSFFGRDYLVEGIVGYHVNGKRFQLARAVDGDAVLWVEPLREDADDRLLVFKEVRDLEMAIPPPASILYGQGTYLQRLAGKATIEVAGSVPDRSAGTVQVWRYHAAGDLVLHIESGPSGTWTAAGESVHRGMIDILPGK
jgi:Domain of unknown function (DUF4178)